MNLQKNVINEEEIALSERRENDICTLSVYVNNKPGVLMRICQIFSRRAYNIDSLVVSHGINRQYARMTIGISGDSDGLSQIISQVNKLIDVIHCIEHGVHDSVTKELALIKIVSNSKDFIEISQIIHSFSGEIIDYTEVSIIVMVHGDPEKINWVIQLLSKYKIVETIRSGKIVVAKSEYTT